MNKYWSSWLDGIVPYVPGEQPKNRKFIKLNTNENPYPPSENVEKAIKSFNVSDLRLYPDPECEALIGSIASFYGVEKQQVFVGNGSDEILAFCFPAFFSRGDEISFADITYSFYPVYSKLFSVNYREISLNDDFTIPVDEFCKKTDGVIIPNPNAPTGIALELKDIERILNANKDSVVIIDEAYVDFGAESAVSLVDKYPNLLVVQTFSKSRSLAGMRAGFAIGDENLINALNCVKNSINSYTMDRIALVAAKEAVDDREYFNETCGKIIKTREKTVERLKSLGFNIPSSKSNFIFINHPNVFAEDIFNALREKGILVRYFKKPRTDDYLRVTIGTDEEMEALYTALRDIVSR